MRNGDDPNEGAELRPKGSSGEVERPIGAMGIDATDRKSCIASLGPR